MPEIVKETVTTKRVAADPVVVVETPVRTKATPSEKVEYLIYFFLGVLEVLLSFRLTLKLMGASLASGFVRFIYGFSGIFIFPFEGIFRRWFNPGLETTSVLEPSTFVAIIVYAVLVWGIIVLFRVLTGERIEE